MSLTFWIERILPAVVALLAALLIGWWLGQGPLARQEMRLPEARRGPGAVDPADRVNPVELGELVEGPGTPGPAEGHWLGFRGSQRDGIAHQASSLRRDWPADGPPELWAKPAGEGYAGPAVWQGRVYLLDYDRDRQRDLLRCISLADGRDIWRYEYPVVIKRNHGMSRTVCAIRDRVVVSLGPKCHVAACDAVTGQLLWSVDMVGAYGTTVPPWYAGQCPLIDQGRVILAPGGDSVMMTALDLKTGQTVWQTPNDLGWSMTHSSVMRMDYRGRAMYVWCGRGGVVGVDAQTGRVLWSTDAWKISIATVPSPVIVAEDRLFLSGGYNAGAMMLRLETDEQGQIRPVVDWELSAREFGATQQTPIFYKDHLFGVRPDGQAVCLDLQGNVQWTSGPEARFGLGPFLIADDLLILLDDQGLLTLARAEIDTWQPLAEADVLPGHEAWGPMALVDGKLLLRDLTLVKCLDLAAP
jgi:outer membrane protein assembly factor BamB